jgi:predicted amidohydrolase
VTTLKVATSQFGLRREESVEGFVDHLEQLVARAATAHAELVVFPELASTGLLASITGHQVTTQTVPSDYWNELPALTQQIVEGVVALAQRHGVTILGGSHNRLAEDGTLRNTAYLVHPDGRVEQQDKIHLTPQEYDLGTCGGNDLLVTDIGPFTAAILICADIQFPELTRHLVSRGVDLVLCPSLTWNRRGLNRVQIGCQARAMENQLFVVMSPLLGDSGLPMDAPMYAVGRALVTGPIDKVIGVNDGVIASCESAEEELLIVDLDKELLLASRSRPETPGLALRRLDFFAELDRRGSA